MQSGVKKLGTILRLVENAVTIWERDFTVVTWSLAGAASMDARHRT